MTNRVGAARAAVRRWPERRDAARDQGLLATLDTLGRYFGLANLAVALPVATFSAYEGPGLAVAWSSAAAVTVWFVLGARDTRLTTLVDVAGLAGVAVLGTLLGPSVIGVAIAALAVRSMHTGKRDALAIGILLAAAFLAPLLLPGPIGRSETTTTLLMAGVLLLAAPVLSGVGHAVVAHERSVDRGRVLHGASTALHGADGMERIVDIAARAASALVAHHGDPSVAVALTSDADLVPATASGVAVPMGVLGQPEQAALREGRPATTVAFDVRGGTMGRATARSRPALVVPMSARQTLRGVVAVSPPPPHGPQDRCDCVRLLETLGAQAAMALGNATLTDDLMRSETRFRSLVQHSSDVIVLLDWNGRIRYVSPSIARMLGHAPAALTGAAMEPLVHPDDLEAWRGVLRRVVAERAQAPLDCRLRHRRSGWRHVEVLATNLLGEPSVAGVVLNVRDVSERKVLEDELRHRADHDPLTGIANRSRFLHHASAVLAGTLAPDRVAMLFIDLDSFKTVNDTFGHATGDAILLSVAGRLRAAIPAAGLVARLSGDEFAVLVEDVAGEEGATRFAERVHAALCEPHHVHNRVLRVSASIGVAMGGSAVEDAEDLLHRADLAMYTVKASSKNGIEVLPADIASPEGSRQLQADLQWAVLRGEIEVRFQPIVRVTDGEIVAAEALARWRHPVKGLLGPETFIPIAETSDLIGDVFESVLRAACGAAVGWRGQEAGGKAVWVSVNLSAVQLQQAQLLDQVRTALDESGLPASLLTLEITESVLVEDPRHAIETLATLKLLGVRIAVDDFGTGYSSLAYLRRLPIDILKMDRTFITGINGRDDVPLGRMIIDLGKRLAMPTIAEGVERASQLDALRALGCEYAQGHLFSRPVDAKRFAEMLVTRRLITT